MSYPDMSTVHLEIAFGADPGGDPGEWVWVDVSADLPAQSIQVTRGAQDEQSQLAPSEASVLLRNEHGSYTPGHPLGAHYPHVTQGVPARLSVQGVVRLVGQIASIEPQWPHGDLSRTDDLDADEGDLGVALVRLTIAGITRSLGQDGGSLASPLRRYYSLLPGLVAYLPLEDGADTRVSENVVPGQRGVQYSRGPAPDYPRAPEWGKDESCSGSAPLPVWPVLRTFGGASGSAAVASGAPPWRVDVTFRVPPGSGEVVLAQWRTTDGTFHTWDLRVTASGALQVHQVGGDDPPLVFTMTVPDSDVADGQWRTAMVSAQQVASNQEILVICGEFVGALSRGATTVGTLVSLRPRPMFVDEPGEGQEPVGLGHMAALSGYAGGFHPPAAATGYVGEGATARFLRLCHEAGIPARLPAEQVMRDSFTRTVANGWGAADTGQAWELDLDDAEAAVDGSAGTLTATAPQPLASAVVDVGDPDPARTGLDATFRWRSTTVDTLVQVALHGPGEALPEFSLVADAVDGLLLARDDIILAHEQSATWGADVDVMLRVRYLGVMLWAKLWRAGEPEPALWTLSSEVGDAAVAHVARLGLYVFWFGAGEVVSLQAVEAGTHHPSQSMGVQQRTPLIDSLQSCADIDGGILYETRDEVGFSMRPLGSLYNRAPEVVLDARAGGVGDIAAPFAPVLDDQALANRVSASRVDGGAVLVSDPGHIAAHGRYEASSQYLAASDDQLPDLAGWRLHLGTWPGMRYPTVSPALDVRPALADAWALVDVGDRVDVTSLPPQHPTGMVSLLVRGYVETLSPTGWRVEANATPAGPYRVGTWSDDAQTPPPDAPARFDTDGTETVAPFAAGADTRLVVRTTSGPPWTQDPADLPLDIRASGVRLRVVEVGPAVADSFARTVANGWGTADTGQQWQVALGSPTALSVDGAHGVIDTRGWTAARVDAPADVDVVARLRPNAGIGGIAVRATLSGSRYEASYDKDGDLGMHLLVDGVYMGLIDGWYIGPAYIPGTWYWMRVQASGSKIRARVWRDGDPEPTEWDLSTIDETLTEGGVGLWAAPFEGERVVWAFSDMRAGDGRTQVMTIDPTPVNGVNKTISAGTSVSLWTPARYAL